MKGVIYFIKPFPCKNLIKIGRTICMERRLKEHRKLWPTADFLGCVDVADCLDAESSILAYMGRPVMGREIFVFDSSFVRSVLCGLFATREWHSDSYADQRLHILNILSSNQQSQKAA